MIRLTLGLALAAACSLAAELPVTEVVLYKNGIGYFVRSGELKAGESAGLRFKAGEMNDVLKSLTVVEDGGGKIASVRYDSSEPLEKKLAEFPFRLEPGQPLSAVLDQLRGARVELKTGAETVAGLVVSAREVTGGENQPPREHVALLADSGELRTVDLSGVSAIRFADAALQGQFKRYLGDVAAGRSRDKRSVLIESSGATARRLRASYVIPAPVWKSSYRLVFTDVAEPLLEGWAIVDNTSGEDWNKVNLALVSGRPVSFISRLFEPLYLARQTMDLPENAAAAPEIHAGAVRQYGALGAAMKRAAPAPPPAPSMAAPAMSMAESVAVAQDVSSSIEPGTQATERGELFEYRFGSPISVRSGESAMLPFLQQRLAARKLLIYTSDSSENPRNAAELTNSTGKTLDGGPITVFDSNAYAGEALMETLKGGDKRLISYAVDLGTRVSTQATNVGSVVREIHVRRGVLFARTALQEKREYTAHNVDQKPKTLLIEVPIRQGYKLLNAKPAETTKSAYRFEVKLAAGATETLPITEERVWDETVLLTNATPDLLVRFIQNRQLDAAGRKQLEGIASQKAAIADAASRMKLLDQEVQEISRDQGRLRENIASLNRVSGQQEQVQKYAAQLDAQEAQLAALRDQQSELRKKKAALEAELNRTLETLDF